MPADEEDALGDADEDELGAADEESRGEVDEELPGLLDDGELEPDVPVAFMAFARMNDPPAEPAVPVAPGVALELWALR
jgi:hypothetical protein